MRISSGPITVDEYISVFPAAIQERLIAVRSIIKKEAPEAKEKISYGMPAFTMNGILIYFAGFSNHTGLYPFTSAILAFSEELSVYKTGKGSIRFPHNKPFPIRLITDIIKFRVMENREKAEKKSSKKVRKN